MSDNSSLDVLTERLNHLINNYETLQSTVERQANAIAQITALQSDIRAMNLHTERLFDTLKQHSDMLANHSEQLQSHSTIWKICGALLLTASGLIGWGYSTIQSLREADNAAERRIIALEYEVHHMENVSHETIHKN